jgi:hypothetical protein
MYISLQCLQQCTPEKMPFKLNMSRIKIKIKYYSKYFSLVNIVETWFVWLTFVNVGPCWAVMHLMHLIIFIFFV